MAVALYELSGLTKCTAICAIGFLDPENIVLDPQISVLCASVQRL